MEINQTLFKIVRILVKFFRFPILPLFEPIYNKIQKSKLVIISQHKSDLTKTASYAKALLRGRHLESLDFYFKAGCDELPQELVREEHNSRFINFVTEIDHLMFDRREKEEGQMAYLDKIVLKISNQISATTLVVEKLCLRHYYLILSSRLTEIRKERQLVELAHMQK